MKPKIVTIKNILRIITSILIIGTMLKSCAKAYTFEQFEQFINACYDNNITTTAMNIYNLQYVKDNLYKIDNYINSNNLNMSNYTSFAIYANGNSTSAISGFSVYCYSSYVNYGRNDSRTSYINAEGSGIYITTGGTHYNIPSGWINDFRCGIYNNDCPYGQSNVSNALTQYKWNPNENPLIPPFNFTPNNLIQIDNKYYIKMAYPQEVYLGTLGENEYYELQIRVKDRYNKIIGTLYDNEYITQTQDNALIRKGNDLYLNSVYLYYYNDYTLNFIVYSDNNTNTEYNYTYQFMPFSAVVQNGQIIESGDTTFNGQDLAIYLPQAIAEAVVGIAPSGDNEGTGLLGGILGGISKVFGGIYDTMFKVESGEIYNTLHEIEQTTGITNMDLLSGDIAILNTLTGEPQDFIISWNNIEYDDKILIPQGNINFSQRIRDNEALTTVLNWVHVLMGFSLITIMIQEYWFTLLKMLGIGVSVYEQGEEERARIDEIESTKVYDTIVTTQERDGSERIRKKYRTYRRRRNL